jgi:hypothetical protein
VSPCDEVIWDKLEKAETGKRKTRKIKSPRCDQQINIGMILREIHLQVIGSNRLAKLAIMS